MIVLVPSRSTRQTSLATTLELGYLLAPGRCPRVRPPAPWGFWFPPGWSGTDGAAFRVYARLFRRRHRPRFLAAHDVVRSPRSLARWLDFADRWSPGPLAPGWPAFGLTLAPPSGPAVLRPDELPWGRAGCLVLAGPPAWTFSAAAARHAAAAAERGVPLIVTGVHARSPRRNELAVRLGAAAMAGAGWSRLGPESRPVRRLARLLAQRTVFTPSPRSADVPTVQAAQA